MKINAFAGLKEKTLSRFYPAILSGSLLVFAFPPFNLSFLAWICIVPFLVSLYRMDSRSAFRAGLLFGFVFFGGTQYWIYYSMNHYGGLSLPVSLTVVLLLSLYEALYTAIFGFLLTKVMRKTDLPLTVLATTLWCSLEYLRGYLFTGFPWSLLGYSQHNFISLIQISDITGVYGVSFLIILVNAAISDLFLLKKRLTEKPLFSTTKTVVSTMVTALIILVSLSYGIYKIKGLNSENRATKKVRISIIQGNIEQAMKWNPSYQKEVLNTYKRLTEKALEDGPDMVVWPETALPFYYGRNEPFTKELTEFVKGVGVPILTGTVMVKDKPLDGVSPKNYSLSNSAILIDRNGKTAYVYDKIHLVPFGEYVPLKKTLFFIDKLVAGIGDYQAGKDYLKADTSWGQFSTVICYEVIFPGLVRKFFISGGDLIVNITNDAWFGRTSGPYQHFSISAFRAVENRKPLVRAANTGISGVIDEAGRIITATELFKETYITEDVITDKEPVITFYTRFGDLFSFLNIAVTILIFGFKLRISK